MPCFFLMIRLPPRSTLFPTTPLFRSSNSTWQTAYCPCPPDCFPCRPVTRAGFPSVARIGTRTGSVSTSAPPARNLERSEEHTSELQSRQYLVCRLLLEKK